MQRYSHFMESATAQILFNNLYVRQLSQFETLDDACNTALYDASKLDVLTPPMKLILHLVYKCKHLITITLYDFLNRFQPKQITHF